MCFPPPTLVPPVLSMFLAEHVKGQLRLLILMAPCWKEAPWLPTVFNMLRDIPQQCLIVKDLIMDILVGHVIKGLPYLHLTLWLLRDVCLCTQGFSSSVCQVVAGATWASMSKVYQQCWKEWVGWCGREGVPINAISAPKLFRVGQAWHRVGINHSAISAFWEPYHLHKASNQHVISKLMHHFYLEHLPFS